LRQFFFVDPLAVDILDPDLTALRSLLIDVLEGLTSFEADDGEYRPTWSPSFDVLNHRRPSPKHRAELAWLEKPTPAVLPCPPLP
jgi:hypothetical protein